jgi:hypothetical protein
MKPLAEPDSLVSAKKKRDGLAESWAFGTSGS